MSNESASLKSSQIVFEGFGQEQLEKPSNESIKISVQNKEELVLPLHGTSRHPISILNSLKVVRGRTKKSSLILTKQIENDSQSFCQQKAMNNLLTLGDQESSVRDQIVGNKRPSINKKTHLLDSDWEHENKENRWDEKQTQFLHHAQAVKFKNSAKNQGNLKGFDKIKFALQDKPIYNHQNEIKSHQEGSEQVSLEHNTKQSLKNLLQKLESKEIKHHQKPNCKINKNGSKLGENKANDFVALNPNSMTKRCLQTQHGLIETRNQGSKYMKGLNRIYKSSNTKRRTLLSFYKERQLSTNKSSSQFPIQKAHFQSAFEFVESDVKCTKNDDRNIPETAVFSPYNQMSQSCYHTQSCFEQESSKNFPPEKNCLKIDRGKYKKYKRSFCANSEGKSFFTYNNQKKLSENSFQSINKSNADPLELRKKFESQRSTSLNGPHVSNEEEKKLMKINRRTINILNQLNKMSLGSKLSSKMSQSSSKQSVEKNYNTTFMKLTNRAKAT